MWSVLREIIYALIGQPSRSGATRQESETEQLQREQFAERGPATAREALGQVAREVGKAATLQPSHPPTRRRKPER